MKTLSRSHRLRASWERSSLIWKKGLVPNRFERNLGRKVKLSNVLASPMKLELSANSALQRRNVASSNLCPQGKFQEISRGALTARAIGTAIVALKNSMKQMKKRAQWEQLSLMSTMKMTKAARVQWELKYALIAEFLVQASRVEIVDVHSTAGNRARLSIGIRGATNSFVRQSSLMMKSTRHRNQRHMRHFTR